MPVPKVIATDLDGTLLDRRGRLSERNQKALRAAREHGLLTVAVTARPPRAVHRVPGLAPVLDAALCCTGAIVYDAASGTAELRHPIPLPDARVLRDRLSEALPGAVFAIETGERQIAQSPDMQVGVHFGDPWTLLEPGQDPFAVLDPATEGVADLIVRVPGSTGDDMAARTRHIESPGVRLWNWSRFPEIECTAAEATKGIALAAWCAERGIGPDAVVAFGDMPNDVPMLAWAGRSYAVGDAHPEAVAAAADRTGTVAEDGVAQAVESILELGPAW